MLIENRAYLAVILCLGLTALMGVGALGLARFRGKSNPYDAKCAPYECGFIPKNSVSMPFSVSFYLVAILFIVFDLEMAFLFPWAVSYASCGWSGWMAMMGFVIILLIGLIYEWRKGALDWT